MRGVATYNEHQKLVYRMIGDIEIMSDITEDGDKSDEKCSYCIERDIYYYRLCEYLKMLRGQYLKLSETRTSAFMKDAFNKYMTRVEVFMDSYPIDRDRNGVVKLQEDGRVLMTFLFRDIDRRSIVELVRCVCDMVGKYMLSIDRSAHMICKWCNFTL